MLKTRMLLFWLGVLGFVLFVVLAVSSAAPGPAGAAEGAAAPAAAERTEAAPERPSGLVGTIVAVVPGSRTLVVDVPVGDEVLRLGAGVTERTKITAAGAPAVFADLAVGARVRVEYLRVPHGDVATAVEILGAPGG